MKVASMIFLLLLTGNAFGQQWTAEQLQKANTPADETKLSSVEQEVLRYLNLCRLYPKEFIEKELADYKGIPRLEDKNFGTYKAGLIRELSTSTASRALQPDELLQDDAKCYGNELSTNQRKPHERINCLKRSYAECLYFGSGEAKHIAMQWLIDSGVETLGHRKILLLPAYRKIGIKVNTHFEYGHCSVAELAK